MMVVVALAAFVTSAGHAQQPAPAAPAAPQQPSDITTPQNLAKDFALVSDIGEEPCIIHRQGDAVRQFLGQRDVFGGIAAT